MNTIRLATFARRREIEVMKLVGASNWFVRMPFMAEGMVQGLVGAGLAIVAVLALKRFGFDQAFADQDSFFSEFFVTSGDTTLHRVRRPRDRGAHRDGGGDRRPAALPPDLRRRGTAETGLGPRIGPAAVTPVAFVACVAGVA